MFITDTAYLTREQVAKRLQLDPKTLANWASAGKGPKCIRLCGGPVRYPIAEFEKWELEQLGDND
jgi:predicted DNA-binding transcriptional regulator AlpA